VITMTDKPPKKSALRPGRTIMKNPNTGRDDTSIATEIYEPVRDAILAAIHEEGELANAKLSEEVGRQTPPRMWEEAKILWYVTTVKLHLEATGLLTKHSSPQVLRLTDAGRSELSSTT